MDEPTPEQVRGRVQWLIDAAGCETQKAFASLVEVSVESVSRWMTGTNPPSRTNQAQIARKLGLPPAQVFAFMDRGEPIRNPVAVSSNGDRQRHANWSASQIPLVNRIGAAYHREMTDKGFPEYWADDWIERGLPADARAYVVDGDSMEPEFRVGDICVGSPSIDARDGDPCIVQFGSEHNNENCLRYVQFDGDKIILRPGNPAHPIKAVDRESIEYLWPVTELRRKTVVVTMAKG